MLSEAASGLTGWQEALIGIGFAGKWLHSHFSGRRRKRLSIASEPDEAHEQIRANVESLRKHVVEVEAEARTAKEIAADARGQIVGHIREVEPVRKQHEALRDSHARLEERFTAFVDKYEQNRAEAMAERKSDKTELMEQISGSERRTREDIRSLMSRLDRVLDGRP